MGKRKPRKLLLAGLGLVLAILAWFGWGWWLERAYDRRVAALDEFDRVSERPFDAAGLRALVGESLNGDVWNPHLDVAFIGSQTLRTTSEVQAALFALDVLERGTTEGLDPPVLNLTGRPLLVDPGPDGTRLYAAEPEGQEPLFTIHSVPR